MIVLSPCLEFEVDANDAVSLEQLAGWTLTPANAQIWLTEENDSHDYWLKPGEHHVVHSGGKVVLSSTLTGDKDSRGRNAAIGAAGGALAGGAAGYYTERQKQITDDNQRIASYSTDFNKSASDIDRSTAYAKASQQCYQSAFTKLVADRKAIARYKIDVADINELIESAVGGKVRWLIAESSRKRHSAGPGRRSSASGRQSAAPAQSVMTTSETDASKLGEANCATRLAGVPKLIIAEARNFPAVAQYYHDAVIVRGRALLRTLLQRGIERGEFRPLDLETAIDVIYAPLMMLVVWRSSLCFCAKETDPATYLRTHFDLLVQGLCQPKGLA